MYIGIYCEPIWNLESLCICYFDFWTDSSMATFADKEDSPERIIPRVTAIYVEIYSASEMTSLISI